MQSIPPQLLKTSAMVICRLLPVLALTDHEGMILNIPQQEEI